MSSSSLLMMFYHLKIASEDTLCLRRAVALESGARSPRRASASLRCQKAESHPVLPLGRKRDLGWTQLLCRSCIPLRASGGLHVHPATGQGNLGGAGGAGWRGWMLEPLALTPHRRSAGGQKQPEAFGLAFLRETPPLKPLWGIIVFVSKQKQSRSPRRCACCEP